MDHDELLRRLDAHMERGNEIMARSDLTMALSDMTMRRSTEVMLSNEIAFRDLRDFLHEQTLAMKGLTREIALRGAEFAAELRALRRPDGNGGQFAGA